MPHSIEVALALLGHRSEDSTMPEPEPKHHLNGQSAKRWIVVVARGQADLYSHLVQAFARDAKVSVVLDRRKDDSRNSPQVTHRLRTHGAVIIRQAP
jgi:hypothetical protein